MGRVSSRSPFKNVDGLPLCALGKLESVIKPLSASLFFREHYRKILKEKNPNISGKNKEKETKTTWRRMTEVQKYVYKEIA